MEHTIDAKGKVMGRVATEAAVFLMGKNSPKFERNKVTGGKVTIVNASKIKIHPGKLNDKLYKRYSGYPGGLKEENMAALIARKGYGEVFRLAVYGMLPSNKLRPIIMKNLKIVE